LVSPKIGLKSHIKQKYGSIGAIPYLPMRFDREPSNYLGALCDNIIQTLPTGKNRFSLRHVKLNLDFIFKAGYAEIINANGVTRRGKVVSDI
jgi:hypothetical protein